MKIPCNIGYYVLNEMTQFYNKKCFKLFLQSYFNRFFTLMTIHHQENCHAHHHIFHLFVQPALTYNYNSKVKHLKSKVSIHPKKFQLECLQHQCCSL